MWFMHAWFAVITLSGALVAQVPLPFPKPGQPPATPPPATPVQPVPQPSGRSTADPQQDPAAPVEGSLGVPVYPTAEFITSYDAGKGQRYYLYGTTTAFADIVQYYRNALKQRGDLVFEQPPIHQFDIGRFREETMAFPPSVTVKDYTWGGTGGYLNPKPGGQPARFPTIIQIVPNPPVVAR